MTLLLRVLIPQDASRFVMFASADAPLLLTYQLFPELSNISCSWLQQTKDWNTICIPASYYFPAVLQIKKPSPQPQAFFSSHIWQIFWTDGFYCAEKLPEPRQPCHLLQCNGIIRGFISIQVRFFFINTGEEKEKKKLPVEMKTCCFLSSHVLSWSYWSLV